MTRTAIIVGGTSGLGLETARLLARSDTRVIVTGRNLAHLTAEDRGSGIEAIALDLDGLTRADQLADALDEMGVTSIDVLLLNAGQQAGRRTFSPEGFESTMTVNVLSPLAILDRLLPRLDRGSRVVWTASGTHNPDEVRNFPRLFESAPLEELVHPTGGFRMKDGLRWYAMSKLCVVRLVPQVAHRLVDLGIRVNAFDPGLMPATGLARGYPPLIRRAFTALGPAMLLAPGAHRVRTSARHLATLALDDRYAAMSGAYLVDLLPSGTSIASHNIATARALYSDAHTMIGATRLPA